MGGVDGTSVPATTTSTLHAFITDFVTNIFIGHVHAEVSKHIDNATQGFDASLRTVVDPQTQRALGASRCVGREKLIRGCDESRGVLLLLWMSILALFH